jgi:hypothetical protein
MTTPPTTVVNITRGQAFDVYIGRPGKGQAGPWGNPFVIGRDGDRATVIAKYERWLHTQPQLLARLPELKGKRLGCFCHPRPCHGDVLARLADALPDPPLVRTSLRVTFAVRNAGPGNGSYGVFALESATRPQPYVVRREYPGAGTLPQVAYQTLLAALEYILAVLTRTQRQPGDFALEIAGDAPLVIRQLTGSAAVRPPELQPLNAQCRALLGRFGSYQLTGPAPSALAALRNSSRPPLGE